MTDQSNRKEIKASQPYRCWFCGKDNAQVPRLIAGPNGVFICDECVANAWPGASPPPYNEVADVGTTQ